MTTVCVKSMTLPRYPLMFPEPSLSMCIRHLRSITSVNLWSLKLQGHFENGRSQANIFQTYAQFFSLLIKFQLVKSIGLP